MLMTLILSLEILLLVLLVLNVDLLVVRIGACCVVIVLTMGLLVVAQPKALSVCVVINLAVGTRLI